jgi:hypothetical protein
MNIPDCLESRVLNTSRNCDSLVVNTLGSLNSPVMNTRVRQLFGVIGKTIRTGLQKHFLVTVSPSAQIAVWRYWFHLSRLSMMVIGSFASYTKTKSVESAV